MFLSLTQDPVRQGGLPRRRERDDQQDPEDRNSVAADADSRLVVFKGMKFAL